MSEMMEENVDGTLLPQYTAYETMLVVEYVQVPRTVSARRSISAASHTTVSPRNYGYFLHEYMRLSETYSKLLALSDKGIIDTKTVNEIMKQKVFLEDNIDKVIGKEGIVVVCNEQMFFAKTLDDAVKQARDAVGDKPYYSETIDFIDYPSPLS